MHFDANIFVLNCLFCICSTGNADSLGSELLESLIKMSPSKEEEHKLRDFKDDSPFKLGPAEKFLKAVLDIPFAFKRVEAMLYIVNFDSEVEYLQRSFGILEVKQYAHIFTCCKYGISDRYTNSVCITFVLVDMLHLCLFFRQHAKN